MPRSRNIKHGFFTNDDLADVPPLGRLLFIGLWTLADFNGNMEWKPKKIKAQVLPYDDCDIEELGINLDKSGFISIYSSNGNQYANITNFEKHQRPHINEKKKGTDVPVFDANASQVIDNKGVGTNPDLIGTSNDQIGTNTPDSLFLNPDSRSLIPVPFYLIPDPCKKQGPDEPGNSGKQPKKFIEPTVDQVSQYMAEKNIPATEAEKFCDFYISKGWLVGKTKMKDWKASVRNWGRGNKASGNSPNGSNPESLDQFVDRATAAGERLKQNMERRAHEQQ